MSFCKRKKKKRKRVPAVTLAPGWHLQSPDALITDPLLDVAKPTFNTNYLAEESEASEGHTSLMRNDKDGA